MLDMEVKSSPDEQSQVFSTRSFTGSSAGSTVVNLERVLRFLPFADR